MSIKIVTDSTSDIPLQLQKELDITVIPLYINLNGRSYQDTVDLTRTEFYEQLPTANPHPTTAAPSPGQFAKAYDDLADQGATAIFSIHIAGSLSAVYRSAETAAQQYTRIPVYAIDSGNLSLGEGLIVIKAAEAAKAQKSVEEVRKVIDQVIPRAYAYAKLDTIDYLLKGGRMSSIQHSIVGLLGIKPILKMNNYVSKMEVARTKSKAFERVLRIAVEFAPIAERIGITHANAMDQVEKLLNELKKVVHSFPQPLISEVTPSLGSHVGPGALCINWIEPEGMPETLSKGIKKWFS